MSGTGTADRTTEEEQGDLRRSLGFRDLVVYGLLFHRPHGAGRRLRHPWP
ncbi:hypothetical protein QFZ22_003900 [Streptomyces canus]|uniref:Uncharacterized protein n=1 Tax=Streptomyces canus TaxID=58343 RepID=A0AAW8FFS0_9ACTN|nr:hypothetical protein [Streptomyces canus]